MSYQDRLKALKAKQQTVETIKPTDNKDANMSDEKETIYNDDNNSEEIPSKEEPTAQNEIVNIVGEEAIKRMAQASIIPVPSNQLNDLVESHNQMTNSINQINQQLELAKNKISSQSEKLKNQKGLIRKFYQLEAATVGAKEALEAMLRCFDNTGGQGLQGWPTMQVFTPDGWVKGSVDYNLHNAVLLAKTATTSENLQVIEKHIRGFTDQIKTLQNDVEDLQKLVPFKLENCGYCRKYKKINSKCWNCGKDNEMEFLDEDDDDD